MRIEKLFYINFWIQEDENIKTKSMVEKNDDVMCLKNLEA
jgi:hypothetical protein